MTTKQRTHTTTTTSTQVKTFPAPAQLATVTDLTPQEVQAVTNAVNPLIADAFALYVKTKNFHWHMSGSHFRDYHLLLDEQADALLDSVDVMAERIRRVGGTTIRSVTHISELQTIEDDNREYVSPGDMMRQLVDDDNHIAKSLRDAIEVCEKNRDTPTSNLLQDILDKVERNKWFMFEVCQGMNNTQ
ncbi:DNA starvation/stationary phase protection protein [Ktedonosporobacter rubrisoli]|uniref:DNA starvation/stationary phase protection protein n=1 Tax=Ktedonosporobacter rubrisoli TaxID=2509675 RepID=A0A4P6K4L7_KTERU|nr:DNA starvation/stationary phase protection protein [Ktedonosporobacter rubrisoli]QBD83144.1 DNA starvation/stationary phase protection protein [Ktedonosporobacter rubrisoli]